MAKNDRRPRGFSRLLWRSPIWIYRLGLGRIMGSRLLLLNHTGRKSGQPRQNVLEVVDHNRETGSYFVASGFGKNSDWYLNIKQQPDAVIQVGSKKIPVTAVPLSPDASGQAMVTYAHRHPKAAKQLMRLTGLEVEGRDDEYYDLGHDEIPFVELQVRT
jgi:deazaflavin-dependent oxidoreductase (nitroreductase family)